MHATAQPRRSSRRRRELAGSLSTAVLAVLAAYHIGLALFMAAAPQAFYESLGPFGAANAHYVRDFATYSGAVGVGLLVALWRPSWRVPLLAVVTAQFALHSVNHLVDIGAAHPAWTGYFDFFALAASTALLAWLLALARSGKAETQGGPP